MDPVKSMRQYLVEFNMKGLSTDKSASAFKENNLSSRLLTF